MNDYIIVQARTFADLVLLVNNKLKEGYTCLGGVTDTNRVCSQAMAKLDMSLSEVCAELSNELIETRRAIREN